MFDFCSAKPRSRHVMGQRVEHLDHVEYPVPEGAGVGAFVKVGDVNLPALQGEKSLLEAVDPGVSVLDLRKLVDEHGLSDSSRTGYPIAGILGRKLFPNRGRVRCAHNCFSAAHGLWRV